MSVTRQSDKPGKGDQSGSGVPPLNQEKKQSRDGSATLATATGRNKIAQGNERSDAALGHESQNTASREGAKQRACPVVKSGDLFSLVTSGSRGWARYYSESGPAFLRIGNLDHDSVSLDLQDIQRVQHPSEQKELERECNQRTS